MNSDGQLYHGHKGENITPPPGLPQQECDTLSVHEQSHKRSFLSGIGQEELLLIGLILLLLSDKTENDLPLVLALLYVLFAK